MDHQYIAPWIIESWRDALLAMSFDIPTVALSPYQRHMTMALLALVLSALFWRGVTHMPVRARWVSRALMLIVLSLPAAAFISVHMEAIAQLPKFSGRVRVGLPPTQLAEKSQAAPFVIKPQALPTAVPLSQAPAPLSQVTVEPSASRPDTTPSAPTANVAPVSPPVLASQETSAQTPVLTAPSVGSHGQASKKAVATPARLDVITVYYGTDRAVDTSSPRLDYTSERAQRLELGRAVVANPTPDSASHHERQSMGVSPTSPQGVSPTSQQSVGHDLATQFAIQQVLPLASPDLAAQAQIQVASARHFKNEALIFVPGFNTSFDGAVFRAAQLVSDLKFDGAAFVYSFPSAGRVAQYAYDRESAQNATTPFAEFVRFVISQTGATTINFVAHGVGAELTLDGLAMMVGDVPANVKIGELMLVAPDVERLTFAAKLTAVKPVVGRVTLYAASTDRSLNVSRRFAGLVPRAGDVLETGPLVMPDVETVDVSAPGTQTVSLNHGSVVRPSAFTRDMAARMSNPLGNTSTVEPVDTEPQSERVITPRGPYQRYRLDKVSER